MKNRVVMLAYGSAMNLQEFLNYHRQCPLCDAELVTRFLSTRKQNIRYRDGKLTVTFTLGKIHKHQNSYKATYCFGLTDQSLFIEFYDMKETNKFYKEVPQFLRTRFLEWHQNFNQLKSGRFQFFRECTRCKCYHYQTNWFEIDLRHASFEPVGVQLEAIGLLHPLNSEKYRVFRLYNVYDPFSNTSGITYLNIFESDFVSSAEVYSKNPDPPIEKLSKFDLPLIPFVSKEETIKRLNSLLIFI